MKNKGFTLIELLAVIVVLAIIALIATPTILGVIEKSRKGSAQSSAYGYVDAVEKQIALSMLTEDTEDNIDDGDYTVADLTVKKVKVKGTMPTSTSVVKVEKTKVSRAELTIGKYVVIYENGKVVSVTKIGGSDAPSSSEEVLLDSSGMNQEWYNELKEKNNGAEPTLTTALDDLYERIDG